MHVPLTEVILRHDGVELARATLAPGEYVIGREAGVDVRADTPLLSRKHARLTINYDHLLLEDLASSNGTFVNDQPIAEATRLFPNQSIRLGPDIILEIRRQRAPSEPGVSLAPAQAASARHLPAELLAEKRYTIGGVVAQGGMGAILDARQRAIDRTVAMKVMLATGDEADVLRFIDEAKITGQLDHPNIVPIYELGVDEQGQLFYTMKMVRGITLKKVLADLTTGDATAVKKYPLPVLLTVFQKVCDALAFAHAKGVIHRDLKPENLMLGDFGSVLVMDWGLAKVLGKKDAPSADPTRSGVVSARSAEPDVSGTMAGAIMGTPAYMSPEQARGEIETLDARSDIYALGAILFEILHFRPAVTGRAAMEIVAKVQRGEVEWVAHASSRAVVGALAGERAQAASFAPADPSTAGRGRPSPHARARALPDSLLAVVRKAMAFDPAARYPRVEDLQADLLAYQNGFATSAEKAGAWKQLTLFVRRHKAASLGAAAVLLVGGTLGTKALIEGRRAEREAANAKAALADLKKTAPTFAEQAKALLDAGKPDEALEKIGYAIQLDSANPAYHLSRADLLQSSQRLAPAAEEYRRVLALRPGDAAAKTNLALCEQWLKENGGAGELNREVQMQLVDALLAQHRLIEAAPLAMLLGKGQDTVEAAVRARLKEYQSQIGWQDSRVRRLPNGGFSVYLGMLRLGDLALLRGLPITELELGATGLADLSGLTGLPLTVLQVSNNNITDLSPLRGMKLVKLDLGGNPVIDLSPLRGMPLRDLDLNGCKVSDLSPIRGLPLESLSLGKNPLHDLNALAGMPLRYLIISYTSVRDLRPLQGSPLRWVEAFADDLDISALAQCRELEEISISKRALDVAALEDLPKLQRIRLDYGTPFLTRAQLLETYGPTKGTCQRVRAALPKLAPDLKSSVVEPYNTQGVSLKLYKVNGIKNLTPLHGLPIAYLEIAHTSVKDIEALRGMPLVQLTMDGTDVTDLSPLLDCPTLETVMLPKGAVNVELLKKLPNLRYISFDKWDGANSRPAQTTAEFWIEYDAQPAAGKK